MRALSAALRHASHLPALSRLCQPPTKPPIRAMSALWSADLGDIINLGKGHPNPSLLPLRAVASAFAAAAEKPGAEVTMLQYGRMQGNAALCARLSEWISSASRGRPRTPRPENILITTGSGPALAVVTQLYSRPGDVIFVDSPGYFLAFYAFRDCGLKVVPVPTDANGMDLDHVESLLAEGVRPAIVYTVPIGNNPTGVGMSEERKERLVALARQYGFKIVADEVYTFLKFKAEAIPKSLFEYDEPDNPTVFSTNSFSKLLGPGMRLGWITTHEPHMARLLDCGALQSGGGFNPMTSAVVLELFESGFVEKHVEMLRNHYGATCDVLCAAIDQHMRSALRPGETLSYEKPEGGFFCFITLPQRFDCEKLLALAKEHGVSYFAGRHSSPTKDLFLNSLRLCFAFCDAETIMEGVRRLAEAMKAY